MPDSGAAGYLAQVAGRASSAAGYAVPVAGRVSPEAEGSIPHPSFGPSPDAAGSAGSPAGGYRLYAVVVAVWEEVFHTVHSVAAVDAAAVRPAHV